jgi:ribosome assembly protein YihI (activator of Der GTPase)
MRLLVKGVSAMSKLITLTITEDERAQFEALLDAYLAEARKDKGEHERIMAQVDERLDRTKKLLEQISLNLEKPCGKGSLS